MKNLIFLLFLFLFSKILLAQDLETSYTLTEQSATSAGVYDVNDVLLRTLWSNVEKAAGTYNSPDWDGLDDEGNDVTLQGAYIKVVSNNIEAVWEGVIGNLSSSFTSDIHKELNFYHDMLIHDGGAYFASEYTEGHGSVIRTSLESMGITETIMPNFIQQSSERIATDGVRLYMAGRQSWDLNFSYVQAATFENLDNWNAFEEFQGATVKIFDATFKVTDIVDSHDVFPQPNNDDNLDDYAYNQLLYNFELASPRVTGLAVQTTGNYLFVAREKLNSLHILHKLTGELLHSTTYLSPKHTKVDMADNLWMVYDDVNGNEIVEKYSVDATSGVITSTGFTLTGLTNIQAITFSPDGTTVAIADAADNAHQVKGYEVNTGELLWTLGKDESYSESAKVYDDKFMFAFNLDDDPYESQTYTRGHKDEYSFLAYESDGSLWVNDRGNFRYQKFNPVTGEYQDQMMWQRGNYSLHVDPNNTKRVFYDYLEFEVDYDKLLQPNNENDAWRLVNNWGGTIPVGQETWQTTLESVTTLSNGRTYFLFQNPRIEGETRARPWSVFELVEDGVMRNTGVSIANFEDGSFYNDTWPQLKSDGTFRWINDTGTQTFYEKKVTGFDSDNNPILSDLVVWDEYDLNENDIRQNGARRVSGELTSKGNMVLFDGSQGEGFHLAAWNKDLNTYAFKTAKGVKYEDWVDPYPTDGTYDLRDNVEYGGSVALAMDDWIIWGYHGEFWENGQTNKWHLVTDEGLFLRDFGVTAGQTTNLPEHSPGMAGNAFSPALAKHNDDVTYLWHNDESHHAGAHRWKISNIESIKKFDLKIGGVASTDETVLESIKIYPNPTVNKVNVLGVKGGVYELFDQAGRLYKSGNIVSEHQIISLENFSKGVYIIKVLHEGYVSVEKLILK